MSQLTLQLLRFTHIVSASFWVGSAATLAFFVYPALLAPGSGGMPALRDIMRRRRLTLFLMGSMLISIASGLTLYWHDFGRMFGGPMSRQALDLALGGFLAILAGIVGVFVNMPAGMQLGAISSSVGPGGPTPEQADHISRLGARILIGMRCISILTLGAAALMAVARYAR